MKTNDLENELRNLKFTHLTEGELIAYCDQGLDHIQHARMEAHLKQCFICERQLALLREENEALSKQEIKSEDVALVERLIEQMGMAQKPSGVRPVEIPKGVLWQERLAESLRQMTAAWRIAFMQGATRGVADQDKEVWRWQSEDGRLQGRATMEENADLIVHFSSSKIDLDGTRLSFRLGQMSQEITLQQVSESEVYGKVAVPWQQRQGNMMADISIEII